VSVVVDDLWQQIAPLVHRPGPQPECSDSKLLAMILIGEWRGWDVETHQLSYWREYRHLFPRQPAQSRFNRRRRALAQAMNCMRRAVLGLLDLARDGQAIVDSLPVPVVHFHLAPSSTGDWDVHGASFGQVPSKKQTIYGYKLHTLVTLSGVILDFVLAPAHASDLPVGVDLLEEHTDLTVCGGRAYVSAAHAATLKAHTRLRLLAETARRHGLAPAHLLSHSSHALAAVVCLARRDAAAGERAGHCSSPVMVRRENPSLCPVSAARPRLGLM